MINNGKQLAHAVADANESIYDQLFKMVTDPFLRERLTFDPPQINTNERSCDIWVTIKPNVPAEEHLEVIEHLTDCLFRVRSVIKSGRMLRMTYKSDLKWDEWTRLVNSCEKPSEEPSEDKKSDGE